MAGEVRVAESTGILQKYGAGDENRIAFQISKPHRKKVLTAALRANCCQTLPSRMRAGHLHWSGDARQSGVCRGRIDRKGSDGHCFVVDNLEDRV